MSSCKDIVLGYDCSTTKISVSREDGYNVGHRVRPSNSTIYYATARYATGASSYQNEDI